MTRAAAGTVARAGGCLAGATLLIALAVEPARANPAEHFGLGSRASGLGLAGVASANDFSAVFYNPAGLLLAPGSGYSLGYTYTRPIVRFNGEQQDVNVIQGYHFGINNLYRGWFRRRFAMGLGVYLPTTTVLRAIVTGQNEPNFYVYNNTEGIFLAAAIAGRPVEWLMLGVGVQVLVDVRGPVVLDIPPIKVNVMSLADITQSLEIHGEIKADLDVSIDPLLAPIAGFMIQPVSWARLGGVYRRRIWVPIELALKLRLKTEVGGLDQFQISELDKALADLPLAVVTNVQYHPDQFAGGLSLMPLRELHLTGDITYKRWSQLRPNYAALGSPGSASEVGLDELVQGLTAVFGDNVEVTIPQLPELALKDRINFSGGIEWLVIPWLRLRGGYNFRPSPAPPQNGRTNFIWPDEHLLTGGTGFMFRDPFRAFRRMFVELHGQTMVMKPVSATKTDDVPQDNPGWPSFKADGGFFGLGLTITATL
ncbi:MAG: hypothetical protein HYY13_05995 [Nitrospirae bacterium]|nr:hypothetical protein [Nitrospirota bacterium]